VLRRALRARLRRAKRSVIPTRLLRRSRGIADGLRGLLLRIGAAVL
jgi:hypothetical protein